jgi:hypothetical protein
LLVVVAAVVVSSSLSSSLSSLSSPSSAVGDVTTQQNNFAVVGMAVPDRVNLFRAQASRAVGGNGRRTSHNPPDPTILDIYDRIGIVVMDENRLFGNNTK